MNLVGEGTLLQQAALRATDPDMFEPLTVIAGCEHRFLVAEQLREIGSSSATIVVEPARRNTAAAAAIAALLVSEVELDALVLLMPADHLIADAGAFRQTVRKAAHSAASDSLTLFGVQPDAPATGYGYVRVGEPLTGCEQGRRVAAFIEKPEAQTAEEYVASGQYLWNSGIFLMPAAMLLDELRRLEPELLESVTDALTNATRDTDFLWLEPEAFGRCRSISIDHAIVERTDKAVVVPAAFDWTDVGSWSSLWSVAKRDEAENALIGDVLSWSTRRSYVHTSGPLVATLGVEDLIVVATHDAVLVTRKGRDQEIRKIVERLRGERAGRLT